MTEFAPQKPSDSEMFRMHVAEVSKELEKLSAAVEAALDITGATSLFRGIEQLRGKIIAMVSYIDHIEKSVRPDNPAYEFVEEYRQGVYWRINQLQKILAKIEARRYEILDKAGGSENMNLFLEYAHAELAALDEIDENYPQHPRYPNQESIRN